MVIGGFLSSRRSDFVSGGEHLEPAGFSFVPKVPLSYDSSSITWLWPAGSPSYLQLQVARGSLSARASVRDSEGSTDVWPHQSAWHSFLKAAWTRECPGADKGLDSRQGRPRGLHVHGCSPGPQVLQGARSHRLTCPSSHLGVTRAGQRESAHRGGFSEVGNPQSHKRVASNLAEPSSPRRCCLYCPRPQTELPCRKGFYFYLLSWTLNK